MSTRAPRPDQFSATARGSFLGAEFDEDHEEGDGAATANKFGALSQTTGNSFNTLSGGTPAAAGATAPAPAAAAPAAI